jgi:hypothetical protein
MHITAAAAVISWPAVATLTDSEVLISLSVPGTTITPVPITKLPRAAPRARAATRAFVARAQPLTGGPAARRG